jgi:hypothetical protein
LSERNLLDQNKKNDSICELGLSGGESFNLLALLPMMIMLAALL